MAEQPFNGAPAGVTEDEFYAYMKQQAAKALQEAEAERARVTGTQPQPVVPQPQPGPQPVKISVFGQEKEFKDTAELGRTIEKMVAEYQGAVQRANAVPQGQEPITSQAPPPINMDEFVDKIQKSPVDAINYAIENRYGVNLDYLLDRARKTEAMEGALVAMQFKEVTPDYVPTRENAALLEQVRQHLNAPFTVEGLAFAFNTAKSNGWIQPVPQQQEVPQVPMRPATVPAPPSLANTSSAPMTSTDELIDLVEKMDANTAEKFVRNFYAQQQR